MPTIGPFTPTISGVLTPPSGGATWSDESAFGDPNADVAPLVESIGEDPSSDTIYAQFGTLTALPAGSVLSQIVCVVGESHADAQVLPTFRLYATATILGATVAPVFSAGVATVTFTISAGQSAAIVAAWNAGTLRFGAFVTDPNGVLNDQVSLGGNLGYAHMTSATYTAPGGGGVLTSTGIGRHSFQRREQLTRRKRR